MKSTDSVIVSWDFSHGKDVGVLIVGRKEKSKSSTPIREKKPKHFIKSWYSLNQRRPALARRKPHEATEKINQRAKRMFVSSLS